ncbi:hypothetical protein LCGC14_1611530 [marine sediment metagenome]|uniref:Uncharacterized protein n=1 Tax=marine sediment metagenome TaxID=412755 RepID=A0A0F9I8F4_9ZZZZ
MTQTTTEKTEICTMRIVFPVESDDQAIAVKKKIGDILADIPDTSIQFTLQSARAAMTMPAGR